MKSQMTRTMSLALLLLMTALSAVAQQLQVKGVVLDASSNDPIIGANVVVENSTNGTITDLDGQFTLNCKRGDMLSVSYIGYLTKQVKVTEKEMTILLLEDSKQLDELIVVGYGVQKKSDITGSIASVKSEALENRTVTSLESALQGKAAGVQLFSSSKAPGESGSVQIRGFSSNGASNPLYVVDGLRRSNIGDLDPNSIESMEILKDAASAAIYGAEAGNGVILITTKKGKQKAGTVTYDYQYSWESLAHKPQMMNAKEYVQFWSDFGIQDLMNASWDGKTDTDWSKVAFTTGNMERHNLTFSNSSEKNNVYIGFSALNNDGIIVSDNDSFSRINATINADMKLTDWLTIGANTNMSRSSSNSGVAGHFGQNYSIFQDMMCFDPITPVYMNYNQMPESARLAIDSGEKYLGLDKDTYYGVSNVTNLVIVNPLIHIDSYHKKSRQYSLNGTFYANLTPLKGLTITSRWGYNYANNYSRSWTDIYYANANASNKENGPSQVQMSNFYYQIENFANYQFSLANDHHFVAMAGQSYSKNEANNVNASAQFVTQDLDNYKYLDYATSDAIKTVSGSDGITSVKTSFYGRLSYDYMNKYMLQLSLRADAADLSQLSTKQRWGYFPAVSAGWEVSQESWFPKNTPLEYVKLRASWGQNGSLANLGNYSWSTAISSGSSYPYTAGNVYTNASYPSSVGNANLKWETSEQTDLGLDLRFLNNRLTMGLDYFIKKTKDLIVSGITPSLSVGASASPVNAGNVENRGLEFEIGWRDQIGKDFTYSLNANFATLKNEVTYLPSTIDRYTTDGFGSTYQTCFEKGFPVWFLRGYKYNGVDSNGDPTFEDINKNGIFDDGDRTMIGSGIPTLTYGLTLNMAYKGLDLVVFGTGASGHDIMYAMTTADTGVNRLHDFYTNCWTAQNPSGIWPKNNSALEKEFRQSSGMIYSGNYFKIKQIQLGYTLPKSLTQKVLLSKVRLYASLDDFFTFTSYPGTDPEVCGSTGADSGNYPTSKKVVLGVNVAF